MPYAGNRCSTNTFRNVRPREASCFDLSILPRTTDYISMGSRVSTAFAIFSHHAVSNCQRVTQTTQHNRDKFKIALVTSSENCAAVLKAAKLDSLFDVRVDGNMVEAQNLAGKPAPDTFLMAAKLLGVEPRRAVVVE